MKTIQIEVIKVDAETLDTFFLFAQEEEQSAIRNLADGYLIYVGYDNKEKTLHSVHEDYAEAERACFRIILMNKGLIPEIFVTEN